MSCTRILAILLVAQLLGWIGLGGTVAAGHGPERESRKRDSALAFRIEAQKRQFRVGEAIPVKVTLKNLSKKAQSVEPRSLFRYINFERLPASEGDFGGGGQVIGDDSPEVADAIKVLKLAPGESIAETRDLAPLLGNVISEPGGYRLSLEYCAWGPGHVKGVAACRGCILSNEIELIIVPG
jgi:hypothetical protein